MRHKRLPALILALAMVMGSFQTAVFADEEDLEITESYVSEESEVSEDNEEQEEAEAAEEPAVEEEPEVAGDAEAAGEAEAVAVEETVEIDTASVEPAADEIRTYISREWDEASGRLITTTDNVIPAKAIELPVVETPELHLGTGTFTCSYSKVLPHIVIEAGCTANIIITNDSELTCSGIYVAPDEGNQATLNIYASNDSTCKLISNGRYHEAGIGGGEGTRCGNINIYSGTVVTRGGEGGAGIGGGYYHSSNKFSHFDNSFGALGTINIYGSDVSATAGYEAAGIGGGSGECCGEVNIYGGTVDAVGSNHGAAIGAGRWQGVCYINIYDGHVTASAPGSDCGAATIGGGTEGDLVSHSTITINGGTVIVGPSETAGAAIGSADQQDMEGTITINGGYVEVYGGVHGQGVSDKGGAAIGAGYCGNMQGRIVINGGHVSAFGVRGGAAIGAGREPDYSFLGGECEGTIEINGGSVVARTSENYNSISQEAEIIGYGGGGSDEGTLILGPNMCVENSAGVLVDKGDRISACRSSAKAQNKLVFISECTHPADDCIYVHNSDIEHRRVCVHCEFDQMEPHRDTLPCVCGYMAPNSHVSFISETGEVTEAMYVPECGSFLIPDHDMITPTETYGEYNKFYGWLRQDYEQFDLLYPGTVYTLEESDVGNEIEFQAMTRKAYPVTKASVTDGSVILSSGYASPGSDRIYITAEPDEGYDVTSVSVRYISGYNGDTPLYTRPFYINYEEGTGYSFVIPDGFMGAEVSAEFGVSYNTMSVALAGYSLSLKSDICVNVYMELAEDVATDPDSYMEFTLPGGGTKQVSINETETSFIDGKTYYEFSCGVPSKDASSRIIAQMHRGSDSGSEYYFTICDYAYYILDNPEHEEQLDDYKPLIKAMLNYCTYAQEYFGVEGERANQTELMTDSDRVLAPVSGIDADPADLTTLPQGVTFIGASLSLKSEIMLNLYFDCDGDAEFLLDGRDYTVTEKDGYTVVRIKGFKVSELEETVTLTVNGSEPGYLEYSPMNYLARAVSDEGELGGVVTALYWYHVVANEMLG